MAGGATGMIGDPSGKTTERQLKYGTWVSKCIHYGTALDPGNFTGCGSQYYPANQDDFSTWERTDAWYAEHVDGAPSGPAGPAPATGPLPRS